MNRIIDLRSDTVTKPGAAMRRAIAEAEVGDDVLGDDPTVKRLERRCAELFGKQAAVFVPTGTMANAVSIRSVCEPGDEVVCDDTTHSYNYETAAPAALCGVSLRLIDGERGIYTGDDVRRGVRADSIHFPHSRMCIIENTNNRGGGAIWPIENITSVRNACDEHKLWLHLDGARLMNACVATGKKPTDFTKYFDSLSMCFSKGLGAPVGSIVAGSADFITRCRRFRKMFGGVMRQSGILAAAALYGLDHNVERLAEDHANARLLADAIADLDGIDLDPATVQTNIVIFRVDPKRASAADFAARLGEGGVRVIPTGPDTIRAVTHLDVSRDDIEAAITVFREACAGVAA
ncbi:MAG: low-specificity L-threonine aldolase [Phycisphaerales bacterium]|nr:low-specificity L-threonine aldolase [Phycisphaerales bacterium]